jgi:hypothetical protein
MKPKNFPKKLNLTTEQIEMNDYRLDDQLFVENNFGSQIQEQLDPDLLRILNDDFNLDET